MPDWYAAAGYKSFKVPAPSGSPDVKTGGPDTRRRRTRINVFGMVVCVCTNVFPVCMWVGGWMGGWMDGWMGGGHRDMDGRLTGAWR